MSKSKGHWLTDSLTQWVISESVSDKVTYWAVCGQLKRRAFPSHLKMKRKKNTLILFPSQKAPWPFWAVQVWLWIGLCTMQNSTCWNQKNIIKLIYNPYSPYNWNIQGLQCLTFSTMKARIVQMLGLLWMKLVVPSECDIFDHFSLGQNSPLKIWYAK